MLALYTCYKYMMLHIYVLYIKYTKKNFECLCTVQRNRVQKSALSPNITH